MRRKSRLPARRRGRLTVLFIDHPSSRGFFGSTRPFPFFQKTRDRETQFLPRKNAKATTQPSRRGTTRRARRPRDVETMSVRYVRATTPGVLFRFRSVPRVGVLRFQTRDLKSPRRTSRARCLTPSDPLPLRRAGHRYKSCRTAALRSRGCTSRARRITRSRAGPSTSTRPPRRRRRRRRRASETRCASP